MSARALCAIGALGAVMGVAQPAVAFCRTTTCDPATEQCQLEGRCIVSGFPLFWPAACVSFAVQQDGTPLRGVSFEVAREVVADGFGAWVNADCGGGVHPSLGLKTHGKAICDEQVYNQDGPNANVWMFRDDAWPYTSMAGHTLALTTVTFNVDDGEIFDVDVEVNSVQNDLTLSPTEVKNDLPSIVTHEAGHFLGLSHSEVEDATMFAVYQAGTTSLRDLHPDDMLGICRIYPPGRQPRTQNCEPRRGFVSECSEQIETATCSCMAPGQSRESGLIALGAFAVASFVLRRRNSAVRRRNDDKKAGHDPGSRG